VKQIKHHPALLIISLVILAAFSAPLLPGWKQRGSRSYVRFPAAIIAQAAEVNPWTRAIEKIKEDRGEPTGKQAKVEIPAEVRHYSDTRRFLAIQVAEWRQHSLRTPQDLVDLAAMIRQGEMVTLKPVTENYVLFGVGGNADKDPFTRFENGKSISLYSEAGLQREYARLADVSSKLQASVASLKQEMGGLKKRERSRRSKLQAQINETEKSLKSTRENKEQLDRSYSNAETRQRLLGDYESLKMLGKSFPDRDFNIEDASARRDLKVRMLSSLRPEALKVLEEIAASYREKFGRPLPITSLVRPDEYQLELSKVNPNATRIETPPHSTGLAFDIYYRYMTADEQSYVMAYLAKLKDEGRIEVLRENRDHYHVFAFVDGARPKEELISASLAGRAVAKATTSAEPRARKASAPSKTTKQRASKQRVPAKKKTSAKRRR
jgi:cell division septum initiation protein DivIVA